MNEKVPVHVDGGDWAWEKSTEHVGMEEAADPKEKQSMA